MSRGTYALHYVGPQKKPAAGVSLRAIDPERYAIIDESQDGAVLEEIEESKAFYEVYDGAVYMYQVGRQESIPGRAPYSCGLPMTACGRTFAEPASFSALCGPTQCLLCLWACEEHHLLLAVQTKPPSQAS